MTKRFVALIVGIVLLTACKPEQKEHSSFFTSEGEEEVEEWKSDVEDMSSSDAMTSTLSGKASAEMDELKEKIGKINSPDKLMEDRLEYEQKVSSITNEILQTKDASEKAKLQAYLNEIQEDYNDKVREYSMPANGIVENINNLTKRLENCQTKEEFMRILDPRHSFFGNLTKLHTLVEEKHRRQEVREMAEALNVLFQKKKAQFGVEY